MSGIKLLYFYWIRTLDLEYGACVYIVYDLVFMNIKSAAWDIFTPVVTNHMVIPQEAIMEPTYLVRILK